ncbi:hypothetical protein AVEN_127109-1 [Araneus ventricosus]|uniref:Uncharacterized protein n=1 Tax=Araneus ventricosus TaxID=182803 RepID=A0A4Y2GWU1_ARAVE|nr:hypothetical protein AVEN_127109-1 [Araneus ventricosus]
MQSAVSGEYGISMHHLFLCNAHVRNHEVRNDNDLLIFKEKRQDSDNYDHFVMVKNRLYASEEKTEKIAILFKILNQHGQPYSLTKLPKSHIKDLLRKSMLEEWQTSWKNGDTGRKIYSIMPSVTSPSH